MKERKKRMEMTVKMQVTPAQGLALTAMFNHWNRMSSWGCSRDISFFVDGDGNFHPRAKVSFNGVAPKLTKEIEEKAICKDNGNGEIGFDYDSIAWRLMDGSSQ